VEDPPPAAESTDDADLTDCTVFVDVGANRPYVKHPFSGERIYGAWHGEPSADGMAIAVHGPVEGGKQ
jgi:hypothetical protein